MVNKGGGVLLVMIKFYLRLSTTCAFAVTLLWMNHSCKVQFDLGNVWIIGKEGKDFIEDNTWQPRAELLTVKM